MMPVGTNVVVAFAWLFPSDVDLPDRRVFTHWMRASLLSKPR